MLFGEARHSMDAKNRLFIPATQREELGTPFMAVRAFRDKCIKLYSMQQWEIYRNEIKDKLSKNGQAREQVNRFLHGLAAQLTPDAQGRVLLPSGLVQYAGIVKNVVIVGCGDYAEIWSDTQYELNMEQMDMESMIASLEECGL